MTSANQQQLTAAEHNKKKFRQKLLSGGLICLGVSLTLTSILLPHMLFLLSAGVPITVAGVGVLADILDPRERYVINVNASNSQSNTMIQKLRRALSRSGIDVSPPASEQPTFSNNQELPSYFEDDVRPAAILFSLNRLHEETRNRTESDSDLSSVLRNSRPRRARSDSELVLN